MNIIELFKDSLSSGKQKSSPATIKNYIVDIKHFVSWYEETFHKKFEPKEINSETFSQFAKAKIEIYSQKSIDRHISSLRKFFSFLQAEQMITMNPFIPELNKAMKDEDPFKVSQFKNYLYKNKSSHLTIKNYIIDLRQFFAWFTDIIKKEKVIAHGNELEFLTLQYLEEYKKQLERDTRFSTSSINRKLSSIRKYLAWGQQTGKLVNRYPQKSEERAKGGIPEAIVTEQKQEESASAKSNPRKKYSLFPPFRVFQKANKALNVLADALIVSPLTKIAFLFVLVYWSLKGKPVFSVKKTIRKNAVEELKNSFHESMVKFLEKLNPAQDLNPESLSGFQRMIYHLRYTRPEWYKKYQSYSITHYFHLSLLVIFMSIIGFSFYNRFFTVPQKSPPVLAAGPVSPPRVLSFQARLTDNNDNPITAVTNVRFSIYSDSAATGSGKLLWQEVDKVTPDTDGIFSNLLGNTATICADPLAVATGACIIPQSLFANNAALFLGVTIENTPELTPRQQLATVAYATNSELLQGLPPITQSGAGQTNVVLALDSSGNLTIGGSATPTFQATGGQFTISGQVLSLQTTSNSNIQLSPNGLGQIDIQKPLQNSTLNNNVASALGAVEIDDLFAVLATSSGQSAFTLNQDGAGPIISASASGTAKFTLTNNGNISFAGGQSVLSTLTSAATSTQIWTFPNATGIVCISGSTCATSGTVGYFQRTALGGFSYVAPATIADNLSVGQTTGLTASGLSIKVNSLGNSAAYIENTGSGDIFTASSSGITKFTISNSGNITDTAASTVNFSGAALTVSSCSGCGGSSTWSTFTNNTNTIIDPSPLTDALSIGNAGTGNYLPYTSLYVEPSFNTKGNALVAINQTGGGPIFTASQAGNTKFVIDKSGNVGIGTTTPTAKLQIGNNSNTTNFISNDDSSNGANGAAQYVGNSSWSSCWGMGVGTNSSTDNTLRIGNTTFSSPNCTNTWATTQNLSILLGGALGNSALKASALDIEQNSLGNSALVVNNSGGSGDLFTASSAGSPKFVINSSGNVGVGTTNPSSFALQVAGNIGPNATDTYNLGSAPLEWNNLYVKNIITGSSVTGQNGYWTRTASGGLNYLSPNTAADLLSIGQTTGLSNTGISVAVNSLGNAAAYVENTGGQGDLFTASSAGAMKFVIDKSGNVGIQTGTAALVNGLRVGAGNTNTTPTFIVASDASNNANGNASFVGNWKNLSGNGNRWGIGPATNSTTDNTLRLGNVNSGTFNNTWNATQNLSLLIGGNLGISALPSSGLDIETNGLGNSVLVANNSGGSGDIFTASSAGSPKFVINSAGNVGIGTTDPYSEFDVRTSNGGRNGITLDLNNTGNAPFVTWKTTDASNNLYSMRYNGTAGRLDIGSGDTNSFSTQLSILAATGTVGINTISPLGILDVRGVGTNTLSGTIPVASISGQTSFAGLVVDNSGIGDIFTASSSGLSRLTIQQSGNIIVGADISTPSAVTIRGGAANGSNTSGGNITFDASNGTGTAGSGDLIFRTAAAGNAGGSVTHDADSSSHATATSVTWNHITTTHSNNILIVAVTAGKTNTTVSSVTYNGTNLAQVSGGTVTCTGVSPQCHEELWFLKSPVSGTNSIVVTLSQSDSVAVGASTFYNVDQTTPFGTLVTNVGDGNSSTVTVTGTTTNQLVIDAVTHANTDAVTPGGSQTQLWTDSVASQIRIGGSSLPGASSNTTLTWSWSITRRWAEIGVALNQAAGTGSTTSDTLSDRFHITASGNVGIGQAAPAAKLDVNATCTSFQTTHQCTDYAEFYNSTDLASSGDILSLDPSSSSGKLVRLATTSYDQKAIGIVATNPAIVIDEGSIKFAGGTEVQPSFKPPVALSGRVPVKVSNMNGSVHIGDMVTTSSLKGVGMKASKAGTIVGKAMQEFDPVNNNVGGQIIPCPDSTSQGITCGIIFVFVNTSWYDPQIQITAAGELHIASESSTMQYVLNDTQGNIITNIANFSKTLIASIEAGFIQAKSIATNSLVVATNNVTIAGQSLDSYIINVIKSANLGSNPIVSPISGSNVIHTNVLSPLAKDSNISATIDNSQFTIHNSASASSSAVASIDNQGNERLAGNLQVNKDATISGTLHVGKLFADQIVGGSTSSQSAQYITNVTNIYNATPSASPFASNSANTLASNAVEGSSLNSPTTDDQSLATNPTDIASYSAYFSYVPHLNSVSSLTDGRTNNQSQTVLSDTTVVGTFSVGNLILADNTINVLGHDLELQPLGQGGVSIAAGQVHIDANGNLTVNGDATFKGNLAANILSPLATGDLTINLGGKDGKNTHASLQIKNASGSAVFALNQLGDFIASGAATVAKLNLNPVSAAYAVSETEVVATGSAGTSAVGAHQREITIDNKVVTNTSLIYITPIGLPSGQIPFLLRQLPDQSFTIGVEQPSDKPTLFNWLIIN